MPAVPEQASESRPERRVARKSLWAAGPGAQRKVSGAAARARIAAAQRARWAKARGNAGMKHTLSRKNNTKAAQEATIDATAYSVLTEEVGSALSPASRRSKIDSRRKLPKAKRPRRAKARQNGAVRGKASSACRKGKRKRCQPPLGRRLQQRNERGGRGSTPPRSSAEPLERLLRDR